MEINTNPRISLTVILLLTVSSVFAMGIARWSMPFGVGVGPDSVVYIDTARNILTEHSFQSHGEPLTHFPPIYPMLLALSGIIGTDPVNGAQWLHSFLFALNVLLIGASVYLSTNRSALASLCSILFFLSSSVMLDIHTDAWSEPPFIFFALSAILLLALHIARPSSSLLIGSAIFFSLALTTRYIGITLLPPAVLSVLLLEEKPLKNRIADCLVLLVIGILPLAVWLLHNFVVAHSSTNRIIVFHPIGISHIKQLIHTMYDFWLPIAISGYLKIPQLLLASGVIFSSFLLALRDHIRHRQEANVNTAMQTFTVLFSIIYLLFLFISISFMDAHTPLNARILCPVYVFGIILVISIAYMASSVRNKLALWLGSFGFLVVLIGVNADRAISLAIDRHNNGSGYTSPVWKDSESIAYIKSVPEAKTIYSNGTDVIYFLTGKHVTPIPDKVSPFTRLPKAGFSSELNAMRNGLMQHGALIVYLENITWRWYLPSKEELEDVYQIPVLLRLEDSVIYGVE